jgi:HD-like signal output (HDOD) protein
MTPTNGGVPGFAPPGQDGARLPTAGSGRRSALKCPPFPPILDAINRALDDPATGDRHLRQAIRADEALSLSLLRYANSAWVARRQRAQSVDEALMVVGLAGVRSLVLTQFARSLFSEWGPVEEFLWEHSLGSAIAAALERPGAGKATEELYLCGLLHNVGKAALNAEDPHAYGRVVARVVEDGGEFCEAERAVIGGTHATVAGDLVADAALPGIVKLSALHHHDPHKAPTNIAAVAEILLRADAIAYRASDAWRRLRGDHPEPPWVGARLSRGGLVSGALTGREELVRVELQRMRVHFRLAK